QPSYCLAVRTRNSAVPEKPSPPFRNSTNSIARSCKSWKQNRLLYQNNDHSSILEFFSNDTSHTGESHRREEPADDPKSAGGFVQGENAAFAASIFAFVSAAALLSGTSSNSRPISESASSNFFISR